MTNAIDIKNTKSIRNTVNIYDMTNISDTNEYNCDYEFTLFDQQSNTTKFSKCDPSEFGYCIYPKSQILFTTYAVVYIPSLPTLMMMMMMMT